MADIKYPEGQYKIAQVGPSRPFSFAGNDGGQVTLVEYQVQLEGIADWVKLNTPDGAPAPAVGEQLEGHVEDTGKYGFKFVKKKKGGFGGGKNYAGAHYNSAVSVAAQIVVGYYQVLGTKPKDINEMILSGKTSQEILDIIDANTYSGIEAQLRFSTWRKCE